MLPNNKPISPPEIWLNLTRKEKLKILENAIPEGTSAEEFNAERKIENLDILFTEVITTSERTKG